jgi:protein SCO1/2
MNLLAAMSYRSCGLALALSLSAAAVGREETSPLAPPEAALLGGVNFRQRLDNQAPVDLKFTDDRGQTVSLAECMAGRPTVFVLAYYRCPMLCNQVLNGVARTLQAIDFEPGKDFEVVVVSFDPTDTVDLAAAKKEAVVHAFDHDGSGEGWHFLIGDEKTVATIADSVGFQYQYDPESQQYAHASGIVVLTPLGRVSRYFYGIDFPTRDVRLALVEASAGEIGTPVDELLLYCFHYDPLTGRYGLAIYRVIRAAGLATVVGLGCFIGVSLRRERMQRQLSSSLLVGGRAGEGARLKHASSPLPNPLHQEEGTGRSSD